MEQTSTLPLSHITVLDLTRVRAGPTAVRQLADWGADVIKIEQPGDGGGTMGGARLGPDFQNLHRNKRSLSLNLKSEAGRNIFLQLAEKADVVVENYRPGVKHRLGIDYDSLKSVNPKLVYASISGFGQDGPYGDLPGFDQVAQGMGGLMSITGLPGQGPVRAGIPVADLTAGLYTALGIMTALLGRAHTGKGQWVQSSLLQAQIAMLDFQAERWLLDKDVPQQAGNNSPHRYTDRSVQNKQWTHQHSCNRWRYLRALLRTNATPGLANRYPFQKPRFTIEKSRRNECGN